MTAMLTTPNAKKRPTFAAKDIVKFYLEKSPLIFHQTTEQDEEDELFDDEAAIKSWRLLPNCIRKKLRSLVYPRYDGAALHKIINKELGQNNLSDALTNVIIPTFDIKRFKPITFSSLKAQRDKLKDARIADVCIGTSAAPYYFPPYYFRTNVDFNLADGGLAANNPSLLAVCEVMKEQKMDARKLLILSLGTGAADERGRYEVGDPSKWGLLRWLWYSENNGSPLIDILETAPDEMISTNISTIFQYCGSEDNYYRLQAEMKLSEAKMDDASQENLNNLVKIGEVLAAKHDADLEALAQKLIKNRKARLARISG
ncbi:hypothetical protein POTOM_058900 [Populus tomentosa]|uniref:PNPLA domain-containing protein n=1 Tax=Populus tomentosa TaxID=118781 RepID=A0A8X7XP90_POPTO|nr:hypothetical protein POTOM_058900 [Populus tomentosa]